jgi:hypothetical protein
LFSSALGRRPRPWSHLKPAENLLRSTMQTIRLAPGVVRYQTTFDKTRQEENHHV